MTTVLVTRPSQQAEALCGLLVQRGITAVRLPLLEIKPLALSEQALHMLDDEALADWVIFISANAVNFALTANNGKIRQYCQQAKVAAVGQATARALAQAGVEVSLIPGADYNSEALLAEPMLQQVCGQRCIIVRGRGGRELLAETLRTRGAHVDYLEVYARHAPATGAEQLVALLQAGALDVVVLTSAEALHNLLALVPNQPWRSCLLGVPLVVISARLAAVAADLGFQAVSVSVGVDDQAVFRTIIALVGGDESG